MYGDTAVIRRLADGMHDRATGLRGQADGLVGAADRTTWHGIAGTAMRERVAQQATDLRAVATDYEDAAAKLRHHADEVDRIKELISHIEHAIAGLVTGALDRLKDAGVAIYHGVVHGIQSLGHALGIGDDEPDPHDVALAQFQQPPPGDKAWLDAPEQLGVSV